MRKKGLFWIERRKIYKVNRKGNSEIIYVKIMFNEFYFEKYKQMIFLFFPKMFLRMDSSILVLGLQIRTGLREKLIIESHV